MGRSAPPGCNRNRGRKVLEQPRGDPVIRYAFSLTVPKRAPFSNSAGLHLLQGNLLTELEHCPVRPESFRLRALCPEHTADRNHAVVSARRVRILRLVDKERDRLPVDPGKFLEFDRIYEPMKREPEPPVAPLALGDQQEADHELRDLQASQRLRKAEKKNRARALEAAADKDVIFVPGKGWVFFASATNKVLPFDPGGLRAQKLSEPKTAKKMQQSEG
jgi:hypothetical protein